MQDYISIKNIQANTKLGIYPEELVLGQAVSIDLDLELDLSKAAKTNQIEDTVDYVAISVMVRTIAQSRDFGLIENLAQCIIDGLFSKFDKIEGIKIEIRKGIINAAQFSGDISVSFYRKRS